MSELQKCRQGVRRNHPVCFSVKNRLELIGEKDEKGQIYEGIIERVDFPNKGIVFVPEEEQYVIVKMDSGTEDPFYDKQV